NPTMPRSVVVAEMPGHAVIVVATLKTSSRRDNTTMLIHRSSLQMARSQPKRPSRPATRLPPSLPRRTDTRNNLQTNSPKKKTTPTTLRSPTGTPPGNVNAIIVVGNDAAVPQQASRMLNSSNPNRRIPTNLISSLIKSPHGVAESVVVQPRRNRPARHNSKPINRNNLRSNLL